MIQVFDPVPLYPMLEGMGFEHHTERTDDGAYHAYFYRPGAGKEAEPEKVQPAASGIDVIGSDLGRAAAELRGVIWNDEGHYLPRDMRLLFAAVDAAGTGRMHHAAEELFEAYRNGLDIRAADDAFKVLIWDRGMGWFNSDILPSELFSVYKEIKEAEAEGRSRKQIVDALTARFGSRDTEA